MAVFDNMNATHSAGMAPEIKEYFDRTLLRDAESELVHARDMDTKVLPKKNGKYLSMRKFIAFPTAPVPLKEGVTPAGQEVKVTEINMTVKPYGRHIEFTDELDMYAIDATTQEYARLLSRQAMETLDEVCMNAKHSGKNVIYADANGGTNTSRADIASGDILTDQHIKMAVRTLEKNKAKRFPDGYYHAIVDPETKYDLTASNKWVDIATYQNSDKFEKYELGKMYGVKFFETTQTRVIKGSQYLYGSVANIAINGGTYDVDMQKGFVTVACATISSTSVAADIEYWCRQMAHKAVLITGTRSSAAYAFRALIDRCEVDGTNVKCTLRYLDTASDWAYASGDKIEAEGASSSSAEVHVTPIYGEGFCGRVTLGSDGGTIKSIINAPGSSGALDPLSQRGTIAWKVDGFGATVLQDAYGVRIEHAVS